MGRKLQNAIALYMEGIRDGNARDAVAKYTGERYVQHSAGVADGRDGFLAFFESFLARTPERDIEFLRGIEDGRHVFVHVAQSLNGGEARWLTMDMFDTDDEDRMIEHWDVIAPWEKDTASGVAMDTGPSAPRPGLDAEQNKGRIRLLLTHAFQNGDLEALGEFVAEDLVTHAFDIGAGRAGLRRWLEHGHQEHGRFVYDFVFKVLGQGDLVVTYSKLLRGSDEVAVFDLWRVEEGLAVEHWAVRETIGPRDTWGNSGKF